MARPKGTIPVTTSSGTAINLNFYVNDDGTIDLRGQFGGGAEVSVYGGVLGVTPITGTVVHFFNNDLSVLQGPFTITKDRSYRIGDVVHIILEFGALPPDVDGFPGQWIYSNPNAVCPGGELATGYAQESALSTQNSGWNLVAYPEKITLDGVPNVFAIAEYSYGGAAALGWKHYIKYMALPV